MLYNLYSYLNINIRNNINNNTKFKLSNRLRQSNNLSYGNTNLIFSNNHNHFIYI